MDAVETRYHLLRERANTTLTTAETIRRPLIEGTFDGWRAYCYGI